MFTLEETVTQKQDRQYDFVAYFPHVLQDFIRIPIFVISFHSKCRMSRFCHSLVTPLKVIFSMYLAFNYK
jgi:hypothetical protein